MLENIEEAEDLFKAAGVYIDPPSVVQEAEVQQEDCAPGMKDKATAACTILHDEQALQDDCEKDVCLLKDEKAVESFVAEEILKMTQAKGTVEFVGPGHCVDQAGKGFSSVEADGVNTKKTCLTLLHTLSHVQGSPKVVRGAQFEGGVCQVLFEESDTAAVELANLPQVFGAKVAKDGQGMVSSTDSSEGAVCFKMIDCTSAIRLGSVTDVMAVNTQE